MKLSKLAVAGALSLAALGGQAEASVVIDITQVGGDVVVSGSGTIDLTDIHFVESESTPGGGALGAALGVAVVGAGGGVDLYFPASGPASFGTGALLFPVPGSGDTFGVDMSFPGLFVPSGYVSGSPLSGSSTLDGQTFASLGLTPGMYVYSWGSGADADSLTVNIGAIPEPSTWALMLLGLAGLGALAYRRNRSGSRPAKA